jgi:hypothetical protein
MPALTLVPGAGSTRPAPPVRPPTQHALAVARDLAIQHARMDHAAEQDDREPASPPEHQDRP